MPGRVKSSTYRARPVTLSWPSRRGKDRSMSGPSIRGDRTADRPAVGTSGGLLEGVAGVRVAGVQPTAEPGHALLGRSMGEAVRRDVARLHPLNPIVADCRRGLQPGLDVARLDRDAVAARPTALGGMVAPDTGIAVGLELQRHRQRILLIGLCRLR